MSALRNAVLGCVLATASIPAQAAPADVPSAANVQAEGLPPELESYIVKALADWKVPGAAVTVVYKGKVLAANGYGVRALGRPERVNGDTIFNIASLSKSFTSAGAALLVGEGKLSWDDPVRKWLPGFELADPWITREVTLRDVLSHRTGLEPANFAWRFTGMDREEVIRRLRYTKPRVPFRTQQLYSNSMFSVGGEVTAAAAGMPWEQFIRTRLLAPLQMTRSSLGPQGLRDANVAQPHAEIEGVQQVIRAWDYTNIGPAGEVNSTARDMSHWLLFQLGDGLWNGKQVVDPSAIQATHEPWTIIPTTPQMRAARQVEVFAGYGLGWNVMDYRGHRVLWHSGNADGMVAYMALLPKEQLGVAVLLNTWSASTLHGELTSRIIDALLGLPTQDYSGLLLKRVAAQGARQAPAPPPDEAARYPSLPLQRYAGTYSDDLFGDILVGVAGPNLSLRFAKGEQAELRHIAGNAFRVVWKDPLFRESYPTTVTFALDDKLEPETLSMSLERDEIHATRRQ